MGRYLVCGRYTPEATAAVREAGYASRVEVLEGMFESLGGRLESVYFTIGDLSILGIAELPSTAAEFALDSFTWATGTIESAAIYPLFTGEEADAAIAAQLSWAPPGQG